MEADKIIPIFKKWIDAQLRVSSKDDVEIKPSVSFIESQLLKYPITRHFAEEIGPQNFIKVCFTLFEMYRGLSMEDAWSKSSVMYFVNIVKFNNIEDEKDTCSSCDGHGDVECGMCNGQGHTDCDQCDGTGEMEIEYSNGDSETVNCDYCGGDGNVECDYCYGNGDVNCDDCDGDGEVETGDETIEVSTERWGFISNDVYNNLSDIDKEIFDDEDKIYDLIPGNEVLLLSSGHLYTETLNFDEVQREYGDISENDIMVYKIGKLSPGSLHFDLRGDRSKLLSNPFI
jgi:hypothetical protein